MLILRRLTSEGSQMNDCLGKHYNFVDWETNKDEFGRTAKSMKIDAEELEKIYAFVIYENGSQVMPLYKKSKYYVMTENGATFANISYR